MSVLLETDAAKPVGQSDRELSKAFLSSEWRIIPLLFCLWMLAWVDRANVAFAKLQMLSDLHFSETAYGLGAGLFFLGYVVMGVPSTALQQRWGARTVISAIAIGWGMTSIAMMFVSSPTVFYALRFLLGAFEAGFYPGVILYFNEWFPTQRRTRNFSIFHSAAICSTIAVGLSGGFVLEHMSGVLGLAGWRWMFVLQAVPTVLLGCVAAFVLPDGPASARWLSAREREMILQSVAQDRQKFAPASSQSSALFANPMLWMLAGIYFCILTANSALGFFMPTILHEAGFGGYREIGNAIAAICLLGAAGNIAFSTFASRYRDNRWFCAIASLVSVISLMVLVFAWHSNRTTTFCTLVLAIAGTGAGVSLFWQIPTRFLKTGETALAIPLISSISNLAGFLTPWLTGYVRDLSGSYASGFITAGAVQAISAVLLVAGIPLIARRMKSNIQATEV
ncbi:MFS transporter [Paraburkholderia silviterrae]|uniref:MFS transporter n=1 Tax=Paraburkholderia silviterrae TaxID=2528715 RepID=A0A4R5M1V5_9BURK|nr:MFS transporter [Paraburkholderia silviterrae]TDG19329.1 MFS transporter [Paraburkholderia silviterrae]